MGVLKIAAAGVFKEDEEDVKGKFWGDPDTDDADDESAAPVAALLKSGARIGARILPLFHKVLEGGW